MVKLAYFRIHYICMQGIDSKEELDVAFCSEISLSVYIMVFHQHFIVFLFVVEERFLYSGSLESEMGYPYDSCILSEHRGAMVLSRFYLLQQTEGSSSLSVCLADSL